MNEDKFNAPVPIRWGASPKIRVVAGLLALAAFAVLTVMLASPSRIDGRIVLLPVALIALFIAGRTKAFTIDPERRALTYRAGLFFPLVEKRWSFSEMTGVGVRVFEGRSAMSSGSDGAVGRVPDRYGVLAMPFVGRPIKLEVFLNKREAREFAERLARIMGVKFQGYVSGRRR